jgi:hypothetical protein
VVRGKTADAQFQRVSFQLSAFCLHLLSVSTSSSAFQFSAFAERLNFSTAQHLNYLGQAARSFAAISLYSASGSFLLGAGVPGAFPPKEGMT